MTARSTVTVVSSSVAALPAASVARAEMRRLPTATVVLSQEYEYGALADSPTLVPSTRNSTLATAKSSMAVAVRSTTPDTVAALAGAVTFTVGARVSITPPVTVTRTSAKALLAAAS